MLLNLFFDEIHRESNKTDLNVTVPMIFDIIITSYEQTPKTIERSYQRRREVPVHYRQGLSHS